MGQAQVHGQSRAELFPKKPGLQPHILEGQPGGSPPRQTYGDDFDAPPPPLFFNALG